MLDQLYLHKQSIIHALNIWTKFICILIIFPLAVLFSNFLSMLIATLLFSLLLYFSRISFLELWSRVKFYVLAYSVIFMVVAVVWGTGIFFTRLQLGFLFAWKVIIISISGVLFSLVTDPIEIPSGMLRIGLPHKYGIALMVAYRMIPLLNDKLVNIMRAQKARGADFNFAFRRLPQNFSALLSLMIPMVSSSLEASVGLADTLIARGYSPNRRISIPPGRLTLGDVLLPLVVIIFFVFSAMHQA